MTSGPQRARRRDALLAEDNPVNQRMAVGLLVLRKRVSQRDRVRDDAELIADIIRLFLEDDPSPPSNGSSRSAILNASPVVPTH